MRVLATVTATAVALALPLSVAHAQGADQASMDTAASVGGKWTVSTQTDQGAMSSVLDLKQDGAKITGSLASEMGTNDVAGEYTDGTLAFGLTMETGNGALELMFTGKVQADGSLAGTIDFGEGTLPFTATRVAAPSAAGKWSMSINSPQGAMAATLDLKIADAVISGSLSSDLGVTELEGEVDGHDLYFGIYFDDGSGSGMEIWFTGAMSEDGATMTGTFDIGQGPMEWTAKRAG